MCDRGTYVAGGMCGRGHAWQGGGAHAWHARANRKILRDTVNEPAVLILLECILVTYMHLVKAKVY